MKSERHRISHERIDPDLNLAIRLERLEHPDEQERYGKAGMAWCIHDNQHILNWAALESNGYGASSASWPGWPVLDGSG